jgi:hypothetical protein
LLEQVDTRSAAAKLRTVNADERELEADFPAGAGTDHPPASNTVQKNNKAWVETIRKELVVVGLSFVLCCLKALAGCRVTRLRNTFRVDTAIRGALIHAG